MPATPAPAPLLRWLLWASLAAYATGRIAEIFAGRLPNLLIVLLQVVPPAVFACVHGSIRFGIRTMLLFAACCLDVAAFFESLSLRTGFPFGHYVFTDLMGPKLAGLPPLLVLAYLGIGYVSWTIAEMLLGSTHRFRPGTRIVALSLLATSAMLAWDLAMDPVWAGIEGAWVWLDGGAYFGVPLSNFFGWFLTAFVFYLLFALGRRSVPPDTRTLETSDQVAVLKGRDFSPVMRDRKIKGLQPRRECRELNQAFWRMAPAFYGLCALGNLLLLAQPRVHPVFIDHSGRAWSTAAIVHADVWVSLLVMVPLAAAAWLRANALAAKNVSA